MTSFYFKSNFFSFCSLSIPSVGTRQCLEYLFTFTLPPSVVSLSFLFLSQVFSFPTLGPFHTLPSSLIPVGIADREFRATPKASQVGLRILVWFPTASTSKRWDSHGRTLFRRDSRGQDCASGVCGATGREPGNRVLGILEIFAVSQGIVGIRGVFSNKFLAMSKKGKLHASAKFTDDCKFRERFQENSYNTYASAIHRTEPAGREWYVALNKRGKAKRGCSPRVKPQHISTHFLPRFKQLEQPELSFTVTVPEKKKPPSPVKPKVPLSAPRKSPNTVKYRLKFRFG
ncbi:fibroblast growth factor 5 [Lynx pardinus]|uniref:Fibroblast growth factor n=1 Tax=Lynx pardinus TaxID=191816 RepID=A0A485NU06_LYNPA|nr:fibroblast growth factor 5 [Lynx pardinus]